MTQTTQDQNLRSQGPDHAVYLGRAHFGSLNGLRFLCILAVLWHHAPVWTAMTDAPRLLQRGFLGVDFFFILSGFLITTLLLREEDRKGGFSVIGFYWRRVLRIVPVYLLVVTLLGLYYIAVKGMTEYLHILPYYYLFLSNFLTTDIPMLAPMWSLAVEQQYYLIWPLLLMLVPRRHMLWVLAGLIALNVVAVSGGLRVIGIHPIDIGPLTLRMFTATYAPILIGSGVALLLHQRRGFIALAAVFGGKSTAVGLFALLLILVQILPDDVSGLPNLCLHLTMAACLVSLVLREDQRLGSALRWAPVARIGEISYGIYLYHLIVSHFATQALSEMGLGTPWLVFILYSLLSIAVAEVSFRYFETPILRFRHFGPGRTVAGQGPSA